MHRNELNHFGNQHRAAAADTGSTDMALNTSWMHRNGWAQMFAAADRRFLVQLAQLPQATERPLCLGVYDGAKLHNSSQDEAKLSAMIIRGDQE